MTGDATAGGSSCRPGASAACLRLADRSDRTLGRTVTEARKTALTPNVRSRPMLKIPRWLAIVKLPKPTIVDKAEKATARPVLYGRGAGRSDQRPSVW